MEKTDATAAGRDSRRLTVESVAVGGDGVAREPSGRVVFVPRSAPGDRVEVRELDDRGSYARARIAELLEPGPDRSPPVCRYYARCGGCQLQHLNRRGELAAKRRAVRDALERIGDVEAEVPPVASAGQPLGYRNRVTFTLRRLREGGVVAGYHAREGDELVDVAECPLAEPPLNRAWRELRSAWGEGAEHLPAGRELRITVRSSWEGRLGLVVEGGKSGRPGSPGAIRDAVGGLEGYAWRRAADERRLLAGSATLPERWQGVGLELDLEAFLQVNRAAARAMERHLDGLVGPPSGRRLVDLYAGVGVRAIRWARRGADVAACESDPRAVESGRRAAREYHAPLDFRTGRVEEHLDRLLPADVAVVNPPRAGLSDAVSERLRSGGAGRLIYVSCDPATLARDLSRLSEGWRLQGVQPFDAFPQTAHVEAIAHLEPA